jgi:hypothetical protein
MKDSINMNLYGVLILLSMAGSCENGARRRGSIKGKAFLAVSGHYVLKDSSVESVRVPVCCGSRMLR